MTQHVYILFAMSKKTKSFNTCSTRLLLTLSKCFLLHIPAKKSSLTQPTMYSLVDQGLTHCDLVTPYSIGGLGQHWLKSWLVNYLVPSHYLNQSLTGPLKFESKHKHFLSRKCILKCCLQKVSHFILASMCWSFCVFDVWKLLFQE